MSRNSKHSARIDSGYVEVKSKFDAEFRRFSVRRDASSFDDFYSELEKLHGLDRIPFFITYTDPEGDLLPINNHDNFQKALTTARPAIRLCIQRKGTPAGGQSMLELNGFGTLPKKKNPLISRIMASEAPTPRVQIGIPEDFRRVSAIIDVDIVPETHRRVKLIKSGSDKPLGFYIRDGTSVRVTPHGLEKVPGVFISRLIPGGLAEMTGLLAVNDEVLEVNGIEVAGKSLDQVTDMMVANSSNLIITVKPVNQRNNISPRRGASGRTSQKSTGSYHSAQSSQPSTQSYDSDLAEDTDEIRDYSAAAAAAPPEGSNSRDSGSGRGSLGRQSREGSVAKHSREGSVAKHSREGSLSKQSREGSVARQAGSREGSVAKQGSVARQQGEVAGGDMVDMVTSDRDSPEVTL